MPAKRPEQTTKSLKEKPVTPFQDILKTTAHHIDSARLWQSLMDLARLGATPKGCRRLALTDLDRQAATCSCSGARRPVARSASMPWAISSPVALGVTPLPPVMTGSHIDTQPTGGKFDAVSA